MARVDFGPNGMIVPSSSAYPSMVVCLKEGAQLWLSPVLDHDQRPGTVGDVRQKAWG